MTIAKIVVPVTGSKRDEAALATAFLAAKLFGAHVEALFVHRDPREAIGYSELTLRPEIVQNLVDTAELLAKEAGQAASRTFAVRGCPRRDQGGGNAAKSGLGDGILSRSDRPLVARARDRRGPERSGRVPADCA